MLSDNFRRRVAGAAILLLALLPAIIELPSSPFTATAAGRSLGWLGIGMVAASLLLMVREPRIAAWCGGLERMYRWHHVLGVAGYAAMLAHPMLLAAARLPGHPADAWTVLAPGRQSWSGILGWLSLIGFMAGLAATFTSRLPYHLWRHLHLLMALAVFIGIAHVLTIDNESVSVWLVSSLAALGVGWRILRTDRGGAARPYQVGGVRHLAVNVTEISLMPLATPLRIAPGQFVMTAFFEGPRFHGCGEYHPYTVSRVGDDGTLALSIKALGDCTRNLHRVVPGTAARVQGPFGNFLAGQASGPALWIGGGIGVTPFIAVLRALPVTQPTDFVYLHREPANVPHLAELTALASAQPLMRFRALVMQQDPTRLFDLLSNIADLKARQVYLCGPSPLIDLVTGWLQRHGLHREQIHFEHFDFRE